MFDRLLCRFGGACGSFYVVLLMVGDRFGGTESGTGILLELLGFALFPFFLGVLWATLRSGRRRRGVALGNRIRRWSGGTSNQARQRRPHTGRQSQPRNGLPD
jgi:hypothetical protein